MEGFGVGGGGVGGSADPGKALKKQLAESATDCVDNAAKLARELVKQSGTEEVSRLSKALAAKEPRILGTEARLQRMPALLISLDAAMDDALKSVAMLPSAASILQGVKEASSSSQSSHKSSMGIKIPTHNWKVYFQNVAQDTSSRPFLSVAAAVYGGIVSIRRWAYEHGLLKQSRLPIPVISVGNLTWGGTGKTPMTEYIARRLLAISTRPIILTRGYAGGDEAMELQHRLQNAGVAVGIGADRYAIASKLLRQQGTALQTGFHADCGSKSQVSPSMHVAILDDGFQHMRLHRNLEVVMVNALTPFGNRALIPRGPLREPLSVLTRANMVLLHHANLVENKRLTSIKSDLKSLLSPGVRIVESCMTVVSLVPVGAMQPTRTMPTSGDTHTFVREVSTTSQTLDPHIVSGSITMCVCGIGSPKALEAMLLQMGAIETVVCDFGDHHCFNKEELLWVREQYTKRPTSVKAKRVLLMTTEKDYWRCPELLEELLGPVGLMVMKAELQISCEAGRSSLDYLLKTTVGL
eukprot:jgi/Chlat1/2336/Chrsp17S02619